MSVDWSKQHCGVHQAPIKEVLRLMPDIKPVIQTFPDKPEWFTWDVKVTMLMPMQYPCIPGWHVDNVPRVNGIQRYDLCRYDFPMYAWISGAPLTQFKQGFLQPETWHRFTQADEHRGTMSDKFTWRCFIRATHKGIMEPKKKDWLRRHCQIYLNADTFQW